MSKIGERIGGFRRYLPALGIGLVGIALLYWPGGIATESFNRLFVVIGATLGVGAIGWILMTLDRQVSDDPRYKRPFYTGEDDTDDGS